MFESYRWFESDAGNENTRTKNSGKKSSFLDTQRAKEARSFDTETPQTRPVPVGILQSTLSLRRMDSQPEQRHRQQQQQQSQHNATFTQESSQQQEPDMAAMGLPASFGGAAMRGASREAFATGDSGRGSAMVPRGRGGAVRGADRGRGHVSDRGTGHDGGLRGRGGRGGRGRGRGEGWSGQRRGGGGGGPSFADRGHHHPHGPGQMHGVPPERPPQVRYGSQVLKSCKRRAH